MLFDLELGIGPLEIDERPVVAAAGSYTGLPMTFDVEIVLRERDYAVTERLVHAGNEAADWTDADVESVLKSMLRAINQAKNPGQDEAYVALRGFSWIAEPTAAGVVIAIEIPMGVAVAGPFDIPQPRLDSMIARVIAAASPRQPSVH